MKNKTSMTHPMHIHETCQVAAINGVKLTNGPNRDSVVVPSNGGVTIRLNPHKPGNMMFHCNIMDHQMDGMQTVIQYEGVPTARAVVNAHPSSH